MSIKAGQVLHDANGFVVDRIQTGGVTNLNVPEEKIYEVGNFQSVATVRDIPDLSFEVESLDVTTEFESLLLGKTPSSVTNTSLLDPNLSVPLHVVSPFKSAFGAFDIIRGIAIPSLYLENMTYRFGNRANATQTFTLRGDSIYYIPGVPRSEIKTTSGTSYSFTSTPAVAYAEAGNTIYALSVCLYNSTTGAYKRLFHGTDYTDTTTGFTLLATPDGTTYPSLAVVYGTGVTPTKTYAQSVHSGYVAGVTPAAVRGKDIDVYVWDPTLATPALKRWTGVQSFECTRRVTLDNDQEFGNYHYVAQDYDVPDVTGNVVVRPRDPSDLWTKIQQVANVSSTAIAGTATSVALPVELRISDPDTGTRLKTLYIPDARFQVPAVSGRVQQKMDVTFNFNSDGGNLQVYKGIH